MDLDILVLINREYFFFHKDIFNEPRPHTAKFYKK